MSATLSRGWRNLGTYCSTHWTQKRFYLDSSHISLSQKFHLCVDYFTLSVEIFLYDEQCSFNFCKFDINWVHNIKNILYEPLVSVTNFTMTSLKVKTCRLSMSYYITCLTIFFTFKFEASIYYTCNNFLAFKICINS